MVRKEKATTVQQDYDLLVKPIIENGQRFDAGFKLPEFLYSNHRVRNKFRGAGKSVGKDDPKGLMIRESVGLPAHELTEAELKDLHGVPVGPVNPPAIEAVELAELAEEKLADATSELETARADVARFNARPLVVSGDKVEIENQTAARQAERERLEKRVAQQQAKVDAAWAELGACEALVERTTEYEENDPAREKIARNAERLYELLRLLRIWDREIARLTPDLEAAALVALLGADRDEKINEIRGLRQALGLTTNKD